MPGFIGQSIQPYKATRFLTGSGVYVADIRLPNMAHAALVRSTHAHARIRGIDTSQALQLDGVLTVLTGEDIKGRISPFPESFEIHPTPWLEYVKPVLKGPHPTALAQGKVHYVGEPVAIVVAEDLYKAEDVVDAIAVDYEALPVVVDPEESLKPGATLIRGETARSCLLLAVQANGATILTVEGLASLAGGPQTLHPIQEGFLEKHGFQCGFCTPGFLMTIHELLNENSSPSKEDIRERLSGNLCRCTGYQNIVAAVLWAAERLRHLKGKRN